MKLFKPFKMFPKKKRERSAKEKALRGAIILSLIIGGFFITKIAIRPSGPSGGKLPEGANYENLIVYMNGRLDSLLKTKGFKNTKEILVFKPSKTELPLPFPKEDSIQNLTGEKQFCQMMDKYFDKEDILSRLVEQKTIWEKTHRIQFISRIVEFKDSLNNKWIVRQRLHEDGSDELAHLSRISQTQNIENK